MNRGLSPCISFVRRSGAAYMAVMLAVGGADAGPRVGPIEVNIVEFARFATTSHMSQSTSHGYNEYIAHLQNHSGRDATLLLMLKCRPYWSGEMLVSTRRVIVPKEQAMDVSIFQPPVYSDNLMVEVNVVGVRNTLSIPVNSQLCFTYPRTMGSRTPSILVSRSAPETFVSELQTAAPVLINDLPIQVWSTHWLGYSSFDGIILTESEVDEASPEVQAALRRYVECGGSIYLRGKNLPAVWTEGAEKEEDGNYLVGLGKINVMSGSEAKSWIFSIKEAIRSNLHVYIPDDIPNNPEGLLIEKGSVPVRGMFLLIVLFGIGIGPVNIFAFLDESPDLVMVECSLNCGIDVWIDLWVCLDLGRHFQPRTCGEHDLTRSTAAPCNDFRLLLLLLSVHTLLGTTLHSRYRH